MSEHDDFAASIGATPAASPHDDFAASIGATPVSEEPKGRFSVPTSLGDAWDRVKQGGLFLTPNQGPALPEVDPQNPPTLLSDGGAEVPSNPDGSADMSNMRGGAPPMPLGPIAGAAVQGTAMAADSFAHGDKAADVIQSGLIGAGAGLVGGMAGTPTAGNVGRAAGGMLANQNPVLSGLLGNTLGHGVAGTAIPLAAKAAMTSTGQSIVSAAAQAGPRAAAIAHYLTSQRDPAYAASLQKKEGK